MIKYLKIKNFQAHRKFELLFGEYITTIVGTSDKGKSAIVRALKWLVTNRPSGDDFIRHGEKECVVELKVDGKLITRLKGKENQYQIDGTSLKAFSTDVPDEIESLLNLQPINFQDQHDAPYWFSLTSGQVSRELNAIVNLEIMDRTISNLSSYLRRAKTEEEVLKGQIQETKTLRESLVYAKEMDADLVLIEDAFKKHSNALEVEDKLDGFCSLLNDAKEKTKKFQGLGDDFSEVQKAHTIRENATSEIQRLKNIQEELMDLQEDINKRPPSGIEQVESFCESWCDTLEKIDKLNEMIKRIETIKATIIRAEDDVETAKEELKKIKVCPTCGGKLNA